MRCPRTDTRRLVRAISSRDRRCRWEAASDAATRQGLALSDSRSELDTPDEAADARAELIGQLFREHNSALLRFLRNRLRSKEEAADVAQEAYVRILRLDSPGTLSYMRASLFTIAAHIAIDRLRSRQVQARISTLRFFDEATNELSPEREASDAEDVRLLKAYINELPPFTVRRCICTALRR